jgi:hypothetical protein
MSNTSIEVPENYQNGLRKISNLEENQFQELLSALTGLKPTFQKEVIQKLASKVHSIEAKDIDEIVEAIFSLYFARRDLELSSTELARGISEAEELHIPSERREIFANRLINFLAFDHSLGVASKAIEVLREREHLLCTARIITEVRPIFGEQPTERPSAALIIHTLRVSYHESGDIKEFFVDMDTSDIAILRRLLDRAEAKEQSLKDVLGEAGIPNLNMERR